MEKYIAQWYFFAFFVEVKVGVFLLGVKHARNAGAQSTGYKYTLNLTIPALQEKRYKTNPRYSTVVFGCFSQPGPALQPWGIE